MSSTTPSASTAIKASLTIPPASVTAAATATSTVKQTGYRYTRYPALVQAAVSQLQQQPLKYAPYETPSMSTTNP